MAIDWQSVLGYISATTQQHQVDAQMVAQQASIDTSANAFLYMGYSTVTQCTTCPLNEVTATVAINTLQ